MKRLLSAGALSLCLCSASPGASDIDASLAAKSLAVARAKLLEQGRLCDKYCVHRYAIVQVLAGASALEGRTEILVAARTRSDGPPMGTCTLYLVPYSRESTELWRLIDDDPLKPWVC